MKRIVIFASLLTIISCEKDEINLSTIYGEWKWATMEDLNGKVFYSSQGSDTTYYYNFQQNGVLLIKDINKTILSENNFSVTESKPLSGTLTFTENNGSDLHYTYTIEKDKLSIINLEGTWVYAITFKSAKSD